MVRPALLLLVVFISCLPCLSANATTWTSPHNIPDPVVRGKSCKVSEPASSGSYIYHWPSKYDQVFWPYNDPLGIWFCRASGYTAFMPDFTDLTEEEKSAIAAYLKREYKRGAVKTTEQRLALLEQLYELRNLDASERIHLTRVLAVWHEGRDADKAMQYRRKALEQIRAALQQPLPEVERLEYLYVAANYEREFGNTRQSDEYLAALRDAIANIEDEELKNFGEYLTELAADTPLIVPGGVLAPEKPAGAVDEDEDNDE
jgi:hypothetical protein